MKVKSVAAQNPVKYILKWKSDGGIQIHEKPRMPNTRRTSLVNLSESRNGKSASKASSDGSCVQPSIGIPLAAQGARLQ